jgi:hypothetical protein
MEEEYNSNVSCEESHKEWWSENRPEETLKTSKEHFWPQASIIFLYIIDLLNILKTNTDKTL